MTCCVLFSEVFVYYVFNWKHECLTSYYCKFRNDMMDHNSCFGSSMVSRTMTNRITKLVWRIWKCKLNKGVKNSCEKLWVLNVIGLS